MDRFFESGASSTPPTLPSPGSAGFPSDGDLPSSTPPTTLGAYWVHMITEEIRAVVSAAGLTPNKATLNQLLTALQTLFGGAGSLTSPGWRQLAGITVQWGSIHIGDLPTSPSWTEQVIVFPIAFPHAAFFSTISLIDANATEVSVGMLGSRPLTTTGVAYKVGEAASAAQDITMYWFALGY